MHYHDSKGGKPVNFVKWHGLDIDPSKIHDSLETKAKIGQIDTAFNESTSESGITVLYPRIEAIHEGATRNGNRYLGEKLRGNHELKSGVFSWTFPYPKPIIFNHDVNTNATGRVYTASYSEFTNAGRPGIIVTPKITDEFAIKGILEERLLTVSIGATTNAAICSVCGTDIINEGWCGHMRGEEVEGQTVEWIAGDLWFDELSWVNVPADSDAMVISNGANNALAGIGESKIIVSNGPITAGTLTASSVSNSGQITTLSLDVPLISGTITNIPLLNPQITGENADNSSTTLTDESQVVKSVNERTEKEESIVPNEEQPIETNTAVEEGQTAESAAATEPAVVENTVEETPAEGPVSEDSQVQEQLDQAKQDLVEAQRTIEELTAANEALAKELSETVAEFLVDLRLAVGKESNRDEALAKFASRSVESLRDSISDLLAEKPVIQKRTVEHVEKPVGEPIVTESKTMTTPNQKVTTNEDALYSLLSGKR
jgi:hypothetical protein